ncbi:hypothetical protein BDW22DRAFT_1360083 [Trametopsis cervina]|nr:hypothetical protein BDW22DRAFT_1360083 [Trametopsis cervina]
MSTLARRRLLQPISRAQPFSGPLHFSRTLTIARAPTVARASDPGPSSSRSLTVAAGTPDVASVEESEAHDAKLEPQESEGWLYVSSVFPVRIGLLDLRFIVGLLRQDTLLSRLSTVLGSVPAQGFRVVSLEPQMKDGGVFVKFRYDDPNGSDASVNAILQSIREAASKHGGIPSWAGISTGSAWVVKGVPWREDMNHYASPLLKVSFDGPDLSDEKLYSLLRPYGRISTITPPSPAPAGTLRSAIITFRGIHSATIARNTLHGLEIPAEKGTGVTRLRISYQQPIQAHAIRDYIQSHPKISMPVLIFLLGSLTYAIFDPIRVFMVEGKLDDRFDYRQYQVYKWMMSNTVGRFFADGSSKSESASKGTGMGSWKERQDAEGALGRYLSDLPTTITFIHGPQGSGKSRMIDAMLKESNRKYLVVDVATLASAGSDVALINGLAQQTGYWPVFSFLNSMNNLIDLASVGLIGQKAGLSSSLAEQLKDILDVVATSLRGLNTTYKDNHKKQLEHEERERLRRAEEAKIKEKIRQGIWHDPRLDSIAGNGVMSELGFGDERMREADMDAPVAESAHNELKTAVESKEGRAEEKKREKVVNEEKSQEAEEARQRQAADDLQAIEAMPIVVLKGFEAKGGSARKEELLNALAVWVAGLIDGQVAHVIVVSDNRENAKQLAKAMPSKPLNSIALTDADSGSALQLVQNKLNDAGVDIKFDKEQKTTLERVGGRASDLESIIHKVRNGMTIEQAVDDIVARGVSELRKRAFGDDAEDAKGLAWTREQAWILMKQLAKKSEISYHQVLMDYPFKGDETPLRKMEHAELISINMTNGRPSTIRPGKPVYRSVFETLVHDPIFQATQDIAFNEKVIASNESTVKACEDELMTLKEVEAGTSHWWGSRRAVSSREEYLLKKMRGAQEKIEALEKQNGSLKKVLSRVQS